jgi:hypothetical protein
MLLEILAVIWKLPELLTNSLTPPKVLDKRSGGESEKALERFVNRKEFTGKQCFVLELAHSYAASLIPLG